jgi:dTDP-4-amino-4,6-dideoxygalactose transaminase
MISPSLSPNTDYHDVLQSLRMLISPTQWKEGSALTWARQWFSQRLAEGELAFFNSGRSALLALLQAFGIKVGDEVLVQAFTCVAVSNSVLWVGAKPVYVDIDETYNMDPKDAENKITKKTKALIIQHTFGIPAQADKLLSLAKKHNLPVIEDCAHALGVAYHGKKLGTLGDASFFSFGRDKVVSSVWGGASYINDKCQIPNAKWKLREIEKKLQYPSFFWIFQQLLHPIAFSLILPSYNIGVGKAILVALQKMKLLSFPVYPEEKSGQQPDEFPKRYPNALAALLKVQLTKLDQLLQQRRACAQQYWTALKSHPEVQLLPFSKEAGWLRFPIQVDDPEKLLSRAKQSGILLGNWYHNTIDPTGVDYEAIGYKAGSCPKAEFAARHIINLPTNVIPEEASIILSYV